MRIYIYIIYIVLAWAIESGLTKQNSYTSYVNLNTEREIGCDSSCVALRIGIALGIGVILCIMCVSIPIVCCCVHKMRQRKFGCSKKNERNEGCELINRNNEWVGDLTSDIQGYTSDDIDD